MKKNLLIARSNIRKAKGQTAAIIVLILFAAMMLNLWLMLSMDYKRNFDRYHEKLNAEHVTFVLYSRDAGLQDFAAETLKKEDRVQQFNASDVLAMAGSFAYNGGRINQEFVFLEKQAALSRPMGKIEIVEDSGEKSGVYLPMLYGSSISAGDVVDITIGNHTESYTVCGFLNSVMAGSHNCGMVALVFTADKYKELEEKGFAADAVLVSVRMNDKTKSKDFEAFLKNAVSSRYPDVRIVNNSYNLVSSTRYISQMICSGVVSAMAFLVTLIALVVLASNVMNYIQENMGELGALKAVGYKSRQIIFALLFQFLGVAFAAALAGIGLSYCIFPAVNEMMISQTGIPYAVRFLPLPSAVTVLAIAGAVAAAVWMPSHRIKEIEPITALRCGIQTHSFKHNHIPLEKTRAPLQLALALKTTFSGIKQNVTVCITMFGLSLVIVFAGVMTENVIIDMQVFIEMIVGETADSCINVNVENENEFLQLMQEDARVQKIYLYDGQEVRAGRTALLTNISDDFAKCNNQSVCIDGRYPKYDNETAVAAKYAKEHGLKAGDEISLTAEGKEASYIICGLTQITNNLGEDCLLTRSGYERIGALSDVSYYINLADGVDIDAFHEETGKRLGSGINFSANISSVIDGTASVYVSLMTIIVIAVLILSAAMVVFVLYLLVRTMLSSKKRDYGILKAVGFTTGQLILQNALSFMPAVTISAAAGLVASAFIINPLLAVFLSGIGIVKCTFAVPAGFIAAAGAGLVLFAFGMACLLSLRIRKIAPRALLVGE